MISFLDQVSRGPNLQSVFIHMFAAKFYNYFGCSWLYIDERHDCTVSYTTDFKNQLKTF